MAAQFLTFLTQMFSFVYFVWRWPGNLLASGGLYFADSILEAISRLAQSGWNMKERIHQNRVWLAGRMLGRKPDRMLEEVPDRTAEHVPDRMAEDYVRRHA